MKSINTEQTNKQTNESINMITDNSSITFIGACKRGQLHKAKYIMKLKPTIIYNSPVIAQAIYSTIHTHILRWLSSLRPDIADDGFGINHMVMRRTNKDQFWYRIQYMVQLTMNKKNVLYNLSPDIFWYLIKFV